jgi:hypothetical protein
MGCFDIYCIICGNNCYNNNLNNKFNWKKKGTILLENNKIIHNVEEIYCNIVFKSKNNELYIASTGYNIFSYFNNYYSNNCIFLHTDCWKFIKKEYNIELKYGDLPILKNYYNKIENINYKLISKYQEQYFNSDKLIKDKNEYMMLSPLSKEEGSNKNILRIKKIFSQFKIRYEQSRKSPSVSASFYNNSSIKMGNDNKFWIKEKGKWIPIKEKEIIIKLFFPSTISSILKNKIYKIPQIGKYNNEFIFVKSFKPTSKGTLIEFIGSDKVLDKYFKNYINKQNNN